MSSQDWTMHKYVKVPLSDRIVSAEDYHIISHPQHYTSHPSGIECLEVTRHMGFNLGNAMKYIWRCDLKNDAIEDLEKAIFYIKDEIEKRKNAK